MTTAFVYAPAPGHTIPGHPESHQRMKGLLELLRKVGPLSRLNRLEPVPLRPVEARRVHTARHLRRIQQLALSGGGRLDADTYVTDESYELALLAAGGCQSVIDEVASGKAENGLALVRPPGHHASADRAEGFCLLNNVALAARHAQIEHGLQRILILDFDVHHGNGTQNIFYADDEVLFISLHMFAPFFYPGVGSLKEVGTGTGKGFTLNVPFPPRVGDRGYQRAMDEIVWPRTAAFQPDLILVSAGFDAHWRDPLAAAGLSLSGYDALVQSLLELANDLCNGRIVFVLEGGYFHEALHYGVLNLANALVGRGERFDPLGAMPNRETEVTALLALVKELHLLD